MININNNFTTYIFIQGVFLTKVSIGRKIFINCFVIHIIAQNKCKTAVP